MKRRINFSPRKNRRDRIPEILFSGNVAPLAEIDAAIVDSAAIEDVRLEIRDRFGPLPAPAEAFFHVAQLRVLGASLGIEGIMVRGDEARVTFRNDALPRMKPLAASFKDVQFQVDVRRVQPLSLKLTRLGGSPILEGLVRALRTIVLP